jgi:acyl carrier protein
MYVWERDLDAQPAQGGNVSFDFEELALAAATAAYGPGTYRVYASDIKQPLSFAVQETRKMQITLTLDAEQRVVFSVYGQVLASAHPWMVYAVGKIQRSEEQGHETEEMAQRIALTPTRTASVAEEPLLHELARAASVQERQIILETHLKRRVAAVLHLPVEELDSEQSLIALGADSLMALELKKQLEVELAIRIPVVVFLQVPTIKHLSAYLLEQIANPDQLLAGPESLSAQHPGASSPHDVSQMSSDQQATPSFDTEMLVTQIEHLSDEQIHVLLQQMLQEQKETDDK